MRYFTVEKPGYDSEVNCPDSPIWVGFAQEQAELILEYLRREPVPDPDFIIRHAMTLTQAAELGRPERPRSSLIVGKAVAW